MLATVTLIVRTTNTVKAHIAGTMLLIILGMGQATALFRFIYDYNLLPQLHFYRLVFIYLNDANVTVAVLAAVGVEAVSRWMPVIEYPRLGLARPRCGCWASFCWPWAWILYAFQLPGAPIVHYGVVIAGILAIAACVPLTAARWLPVCLTAFLVVEIATTKLWIFHFADAALLTDKPGSIAAIQAEPDWQDYKISSGNRAGPYTFIAPNEPSLEAAFRGYSPAAAGLANLNWDLSSMDGALALALARPSDDRGSSRGRDQWHVAQPPGARLIDMLSVRWLVFQDPVWAPAVRTLWESPDSSVHILQNDAAKPRFQIYPACRRAASTDQAFDILTNLQSRCSSSKIRAQPIRAVARWRKPPAARRRRSSRF